MAKQVFLYFSDGLIDLSFFLIFVTTNTSSNWYIGKVFPDGILEIKSVKSMYFPAKCLIVKLKGSNLSTHLVSLLWYVFFRGLLTGLKAMLFDMWLLRNLIHKCNFCSVQQPRRLLTLRVRWWNILTHGGLKTVRQKKSFSHHSRGVFQAKPPTHCVKRLFFFLVARFTSKWVFSVRLMISCLIFSNAFVWSEFH